MNTSPIFINYFKSILTPKRAFNDRKQLSWLQIIIVFFILTLLMVIPVYNYYSAIDVFSIRDFYPNTVLLIDEETIDVLKSSEFSNGNILLEGESYSRESANGLIGIGIESNQFPTIEEDENALLFGTESILISDENGSSEIISYPLNHSLGLVADQEQLVSELSQLYTNQNGSSIAWTFTLVIYLFIVLAFLFMVFVYAYLIYLLKDFTLSSIMNYREAVNLILNLMGIPTIVALVYGFIRFNVITMLAIQIIGLILLLVILYRQTKFQDEYLEE